MSKGMPNALAVLAVSDRGTMFDPSAVFYMDKIATGPEAADAIDFGRTGGREHQVGRSRRRSRSWACFEQPGRLKVAKTVLS